MTTPQTDWDFWKFWLSVAQLVGIVVLGIYSWWTNRNKINKKRLAELKAGLDLKIEAVEETVETKISKSAARRMMDEHLGNCQAHRQQTDNLAAQANRLELSVRGLQTEVAHLPAVGEIQRLNDALSNVTGQIGKLEGRLEGLNRLGDIVNEFLINQGGKQ